MMVQSKGLLDALTVFQPTGESWPRSPKGFGDILRRLAPAFRAIGINAKISEKASKRVLGAFWSICLKIHQKTRKRVNMVNMVNMFKTEHFGIIYNSKTKNDPLTLTKSNLILTPLVRVY